MILNMSQEVQLKVEVHWRPRYLLRLGISLSMYVPIHSRLRLHVIWESGSCTPDAC